MQTIVRVPGGARIINWGRCALCECHRPIFDKNKELLIDDKSGKQLWYYRFEDMPDTVVVQFVGEDQTYYTRDIPEGVDSVSECLQGLIKANG